LNNNLKNNQLENQCLPIQSFVHRTRETYINDE